MSVLAVDQGTTGTKAHRLDRDGRFATLGGFEHRQIFPRPGWVEHDPEELLSHVAACLDLAGDGDVAVGLANQGETVVAWDAATGRPIHNAIVWQDGRTQDRIDRLKAEGAEELTLSRAGLPLDPYFSASKLRWFLDHVEEARDLLRRGRLRLGTSDAFFLDRLTGLYATDATTASRTSLMNLATRQWDPELCRLFGVPIEALPEIRPTAGVFAPVRRPASAQSGRELLLTASVVDQQAALFGHGRRRPGQAKITFGTGAFALVVTGERPLSDPGRGLLPTLAWRIGDGPATYALDGGVYNAASAVNWARQIGLFERFESIDGFAAPPAIERGLVFVPALSGLACPHWDRGAAGMWLGIGLETTREDLCQAVLEGVALRSAEVLAAMAGLIPLDEAVSIDGGLSRNRYFCAFLADALGRPLTVPATAELTGLGTAQLALIGAGLCGLDDLPPAPPPARVIEPERPLSAAAHDRFRAAVARCRGWRA